MMTDVAFDKERLIYFSSILAMIDSCLYLYLHAKI